MKFETCKNLAQLLGLRLEHRGNNIDVMDGIDWVQSFHYIDNLFETLKIRANEGQLHFLTHEDDCIEELAWDFTLFEGICIGEGYTFWARKGVEIAHSDNKIVEKIVYCVENMQFSTQKEAEYYILGRKIEKLAEKYAFSYKNIDELISFVNEAKSLLGT
jgi:hypothetical protein